MIGGEGVMYEGGIALRTPRAFEFEGESRRNEILRRVLLEELRSRGLTQFTSDPARSRPSREAILRLIAWFQGVTF
jgi:transcriptional regulator GlxA family with amidase domain